METADLAREIHRRRTFSQGNAPRSQAGAEAKFCETYGVTPTLDNFVAPDMSLCVEDGSGRSASVIAAESAPFRVPKEHPERFDAVVFALGTGFDDAELVGWLPGDILAQAPRVKLTITEFEYEIGREYIFPLPSGFNFEPPDLNVPKVWSYREKAFWTPYGFYIYDSTFAATVERVDAEIIGRGDQVFKAKKEDVGG